MAEESLTGFYFDQELYQVWVQIDSVMCRNKGLLHLIHERTIHWMEEAQKNGLVEGYIVYDADLIKAWEQVQRHTERTARLKLAQGWPKLVGFEFHRSLSKDNEFTLTLPSDPSFTTDWSLSWLEARIQAELDKIQTGLRFNPVQVAAYVMQIKHSDGTAALDNTFVFFPQNTVPHDQPFSVLKNSKKGYVELQIYRTAILNDTAARRHIESQIEVSLRQMQQSRPLLRGIHCPIDFETIAQNALSGPEGLGLNIPLKILAGVVVPLATVERRREELQRLRTAVTDLAGKNQTAIHWLNPGAPELFQPNSGFDSDLLLGLLNLLAEEALNQTPAEQRFMSTVSFVINPSQLSHVQQTLNSLTARLVTISSGSSKGEASQPFHFFYHLFPMASYQGKAKVDTPSTSTDRPWLSSILREMTQFPNFFPDASWLRDRLIIPAQLHEIELALHRLKSQGFIVFDKNLRKWLPSQPTVLTDSQLHGDTASIFYRSIMQTSTWSMERVAPIMRMSDALTLPLDKKALQSCKVDIEESSKSLLALEQEAKERTMVYTLAVSLFPVNREG